MIGAGGVSPDPNPAETITEAASAADVVKASAKRWFLPDADWRRAEGFGGFILQELAAAGFEVISKADGCGCYVCPLPSRGLPVGEEADR